MTKSKDNSTSIFPQIKNPPGKGRKLMLMSNEERRSKFLIMFGSNTEL